MKRYIALIIALMMVFGPISCTRMPNPKSAQSKIKSFFVKYGKKYPETQYGKTPVTDVDIISQEEIHKNLVSTEAFLTLGGGSVEKIAVTFERRALWRIVSWEKQL